jgi:hypothetical protein
MAGPRNLWRGAGEGGRRMYCDPSSVRRFQQPHLVVSREDTIMKRAFVFLLLAPLSVFGTVVLMFTDAAGTQSLGFACIAGVVLAALSLPMAAIAAAVDEYLAHAFPISLRACLTAGVGAIIVTGEILTVFSSLLSPSIVIGLALGGALVSAVCSLLSHDYGDRQGHGLEPASA